MDERESMNEEKKEEKPSANSSLPLILGAIAVIAVVAVIGYSIYDGSSASASGGELEKVRFEGEVIVTETGGTRIPTGAEKLERRYSAERSEYDLFMDEYGYDTFAYLPEIPDDFGTVSYMVSTGKLFDLDRVTREYFLQPEFYPLFIDNGLPFYESYDPRYVGIFGWGTYPSEQWADVKSGTTAELEFFFKTGWGVETWQGMNLQIQSDCDWIAPSIEDNLFIAAPSYPEFCSVENCGNDWARKMSIKVKVGSGAVAGQKCDVSLFNFAPPIEQVQEWTGKYGVSYISASKAMVAAGTPFVVHIKVI